jgi:NADP-dependent 3-hydroxy acid dehydrogenase YdfG
MGAATFSHRGGAASVAGGGARRLYLVPCFTHPGGPTAPGLYETDPARGAAFGPSPDGCALLVNNAGGALGLESIEAADDEHWQRMYDTNVLGTLRMTRALLPQLVDSGNGHVVNVGSIAGIETYPGGAGYNAAKHALRALTRVLRDELLGRPVRVTEIDPGMVETELSLVRFCGDHERASSVYEGVDALTADDIADCIVWAATRPPHVNIDQIVVKPRDQASATRVHRREGPAR